MYVRKQYVKVMRCEVVQFYISPRRMHEVKERPDCWLTGLTEVAHRRSMEKAQLSTTGTTL